MIPPNLALFTFPLVAIWLFRRFDAPVALCWTIIGGYLVLPQRAGFNLPLLPTIDKDTLPALVALAILLVLVSKPGAQARLIRTPKGPGDILPGWLPKSTIGTGLIVVMLAGSMATVLMNGDRLVYGPTTVPGLRTYDGFSAILTTLMSILPMLLARKFLATDEAHRTLLLTLCIAGAAYSLLALYEVRMSPRLNLHVYGFVGSSWRQHLRGGGFRPMVFLNHGLWLGIFLTCSMLACFAYMRIAQPTRKALFWMMGLFTLGTLFLAKTLSAFVIAVLLLPAVLFLNARLQFLVAGLIGLAVLFYPMLRGVGLVPVDEIVQIARDFSPERGASLQFRINNEEILLEKINERAAFGWGGWGRFRVFDEEGRDISTTDGRWIITMGQAGWVGYITRFGLLTLPVLLMAFRKRKYEVTLTTSCLGLVLVANLIDLLPNAGLTNVTWIMAGALLGRLEIQRSDASVPREEADALQAAGRSPEAWSRPAPGSDPAPDPAADPDPDPGRGTPAYSRFGPSHSRPKATRS